MQIENSNLRKQLHKENSFSNPQTGNVKGLKKNQTINAVDFKLLEENSSIPSCVSGLPVSAIANKDGPCVTALI